MNTALNTDKTIGLLLIAGAVLLLVPYTLLTLNFDYPNILRADTGEILTRFRAGGAPLVFTWLAFALVGLPLLFAYPLIGRRLGREVSLVGPVTTIGVAGLVLQMVGLLRWVFVVPVLARAYAEGNDSAREAAKVVFQVIHQYGGVALGESLGQLFTVIWTVGIAYALGRLNLMPRWLTVFGYVASGIYLLAQAESLATVLPDFPVWEPAGFLGSTLWLLWLILTGVKFLNRKVKQTDTER